MLIILGKLPVTFAKTQEEIPVNTPTQWPGINLESNYTEKLLVGYRWYDALNKDPLFPFGHGLSYTKFYFDKLTVTGHPNLPGGVTVGVEIKNTGSRDGAEVAQMYLGFPASAGEPPQVLRGFKKVFLKAGETKIVTFDAMVDKDVSIWDDVLDNWRVIRGQFEVRVGASSRDIRVRSLSNWP